MRLELRASHAKHGVGDSLEVRTEHAASLSQVIWRPLPPRSAGIADLEWSTDDLWLG